MDALDDKADGDDGLEAVVENALAILPGIVSEDDGNKTYGELWPKHVCQLQSIIRKAIELAKADAPDQAAIESIGGGWTGHEVLAKVSPLFRHLEEKQGEISGEHQ